MIPAATAPIVQTTTSGTMASDLRAQMKTAAHESSGYLYTRAPTEFTVGRREHVKLIACILGRIGPPGWHRGGVRLGSLQVQDAKGAGRSLKDFAEVRRRPAVPATRLHNHVKRQETPRHETADSTRARRGP